MIKVQVPLATSAEPPYAPQNFKSEKKKTLNVLILTLQLIEFKSRSDKFWAWTDQVISTEFTR